MNVKPIPDGYHAITPYLVVRNADELIEFLQKAFDAKVLYRMDTPLGTMHAELQIRDSMLMIGQFESEHPPMPSMLYLYVEDVDGAYEKAVKAGGISIMEPTDQFYGDRSGAVKDASDNQWWLATRKKNLTPEELAARAREKHQQKVGS